MKLLKKVQPKWFLYVLIIFPFIMGSDNGLLELPRVMRYVMDIAWCMLVMLASMQFRKTDMGKSKILLIWIMAFLAYTLISYVFHFQSPLYYLWGFRNNFRFYGAFFAFVIFLRAEDAEKLLKWIDILFWINFVLSIIQFFVFHIEQDFLGGIFGVHAGVNGYTNILFLVVITKSIVFYLEGNEKLGVFLAKCGAALLVATLAELKFFYVEFLGIIIPSVLFIRFKARNLWIIPASVLAVMLNVVLLSKLYPAFSNLSLGWYLEEGSSAHGYTYEGDINRLTGISIINSKWLTTWSQQLFGMGLGNADTSSFAMLNTPFFIKYKDSHYSWFSYAFMYLECGWIGLLFFFGFFGLVFLVAHWVQTHSEGMTHMYGLIAEILAPYCMLLAVYDSSMRTESAYLMYFVLALPLAVQCQKLKQSTVKECG